MRLPFSASLTFFLAALAATAATPDRITRTVDPSQLHTIAGSVHRLAKPQYDLGPAAADLKIDRVMLLVKPSAAQQSALDQLLFDQQNPSSPNYHQWLTPEAYADRFGLTPRDHAKIAAWLKSQGLTIQETSHGRNWIAFTGSAAQISSALHTSIHTYSVNGETHFSNARDVSVPEALADLVGGFRGLNDFRPKSNGRMVGPFPGYSTSGGTHYLSPGDFGTIYDVKPLITGGYDGTGQSIAVVGESDILVSDISGFRSTFGLPANNPRQVLYGTDPGFNGAQFEANLDIEWSGAVAQKATIYYVYGQDAFQAWAVAVSNNIAPIVSISFGGCETDDPTAAIRTVAQQGNAQGITSLAASGDAGGAGCDFQGGLAVATHGAGVQVPSDIPEVTAVGGTMFNEAGGAYWNPVNSLTNGTALSYIPEAAWNETSLPGGLGAGGGGASVLFPKPAWQNGPGVPADGARDTPDLSLAAAASHDGFLVEYNGGLYIVGGTSASTPSMAGIVGLLNHYLVKSGVLKTAGLGNINPQLYRLAQTAPAAFHDVTVGGNVVPCELGSPGCLTGTVGFPAGPGYDQATGLGSIDANVFVTSWNMAASASTLTLTSSASKVTLNDTVTLTATVASGTGKGAPTGTVSFVASETPLGSATLAPVSGVQTASATFPAWMLGKGTPSVYASYSGDGTFSGSGASMKIQVTLPTVLNTSAVTVSLSANPVYAFKTGTEPPTWQTTVTLSELAGVPALLTGFTIDGTAQTLSQYFPSVNIPAGGMLTSTVVLRNQAVPVVHVFGFSGTDAGGNQWSRQVQVQFVGAVREFQVGFNMWALPLTIQQNTAPGAACPWQQQMILDETTGYSQEVISLFRGSVDISSTIPQVFGTTRLNAWGSIQGTICWTPEAPPATDQLFVETMDDFGDLITQTVNVNFAGPPASAIQLSASPSSVTLKPATIPGFQAPVNLTVNLSDKTQPWTATVYPADQTTAWLQLSQASGTGPATIALSAAAAGFAPGAYKATIVVQSPLAMPEWTSINVMWVNTGSPQASSSAPLVTSVGNAFTPLSTASPGMLMAIYGTNLANTTQVSPTTLNNSLAGVTVTVNSWPAPILYVSPTQINIQVPYEAAGGPAVLGINNNGQVGGYLIQVAPSAPGIVTVNGAVSPTAMAKQGAYATMYVTGVGDVSGGLPTGISIPAGTPIASLPLPLLPLSVTVGGTPALIQFAGLTPGLVGLTQVNFIVPPTVAPGVQSVVATVNGVASPPAPITVTVP